MPVIAVINRKGGSGKSTLATQLAGYCARQGLRTMLGDTDRQQSTAGWLRERAAQPLPGVLPIVGWALDPKNALRPPAGVTHVVLDTPGGLQGFELAKVVAWADAVLIPVGASRFDRDSAAQCLAELRALPRVAAGRCRIGAVGMRLDARTKADELLARWAAALDLPFLGVLRETQAYVRCVELGLTVFDLPPAKVAADLAQWQPIVEWLGPVLQPVAPPASPPLVQPAAPAAPRPVRVAPVAAPAPRVPRPVVPVDVPAGILEAAPRRGLVQRLVAWLRTGSSAAPAAARVLARR